MPVRSDLPQTRHHLFAAAVIAVLLVQGCMKYEYKPEPVDITQLAGEMETWSVDNPGLNRFLLDNGLDQETLNGSVFTLRRLYLTSLYYHPDMQVAYKKLDKARVVAGHSGFRLNPGLSIPLEHHSDASGDQSHWTIGAVLEFIYERKEKREARQAEAETVMLNARLAMDQLALEIYTEMDDLYRSFLFSRAKVDETKNEIGVLKELLEQLRNKYELGAVSQFEISTIKLELQQRLFELSLQENSLQEQKDSLLAMTQLSHEEFPGVEIEYIYPLEYASELYQQGGLLESDLRSLQSGLLNTHPDLAQRMNDYAVSEARLRLEIEKQYPDIRLSPGFIFDQSDNIWTLGASWILPFITNTEQELHILESLEDRKIKQKEIIALQKKLLNRLYRNYNSALRHRQSVRVSDEIVTAVEKRAGELEKQIELGGIDRILLLRNRMEFYKARQIQLQIYNEAIDAMLKLKHLLLDTYPGIDPVSAVSVWINNMQDSKDGKPAD